MMILQSWLNDSNCERKTEVLFLRPTTRRRETSDGGSVRETNEQLCQHV